MTCFSQTSWQPVTFPNTGHMDKNAAIKNTNFVINYNKYKCNQLCCGLFCLPATDKVQQQQKVTIKFSLNVSYSEAATRTFARIMNVSLGRFAKPMNLMPSGSTLNYSSLHIPHIWTSNSNACVNHEMLLLEKHDRPPHREKHLCAPPTAAHCLSAERKPDYTRRENIKTFEWPFVQYWTLYLIIYRFVESHHANWLLEFVPPDVNVCETGIHFHRLIEGHKTVLSNVVACNRQSRRQKWWHKLGSTYKG